MNIQVFLKINVDKIPISFCGTPKKFKRRFCLSFLSITKAYKEKMPEIPFPDSALNMGWERKENIILLVLLWADELVLVTTPKSQETQGRKARANF